MIALTHLRHSHLLCGIYRHANDRLLYVWKRLAEVMVITWFNQYRVVYRSDISNAVVRGAVCQAHETTIAHNTNGTPYWGFSCTCVAIEAQRRWPCARSFLPVDWLRIVLHALPTGYETWIASDGSYSALVTHLIFCLPFNVITASTVSFWCCGILNDVAWTAKLP